MSLPLKDLRIIEGSSFVAAPSCGMHLAQLGAEVIRFDLIGGGPDFGRWPRAENGSSFFWEGLNKGKKSIAIDLRKPEGREIAIDLVTSPGKGAGLFVTNFPADGFLAHSRLAQKRADLITMRIMGRSDGKQAVDYTVNNAVGFPAMTGPESLGSAPVNHVLPAWDLLAGAHASFSLLAAERMRRETGAGQEIRLPLSDLASSTLGNLGIIAEVTASGSDRPRYGNALYGAFGRDFVTADGRYVMLVALTKGQWSALVKALGIAAEISHLESELSASFAHDEGARFTHRDRLFSIVETVIRKQTYSSLSAALEAEGVCWSPYRTVSEALREDPELSTANPLFSDVAHPSGYTYLTPSSATTFGNVERPSPQRAPRLGEHTDEILARILGLPGHAIAALHDRNIVASA